MSVVIFAATAIALLPFFVSIAESRNFSSSSPASFKRLMMPTNSGSMLDQRLINN
jgi:hypothetical protein